jgi:hypothetical protein
MEVFWDAEFLVQQDWRVDASDVKHLSRCLPALDSLSLVHVIKSWNTVAAFTQLMPGLTHLAIGGAEVKDGSARLVAQLTSLVELDWTHSNITPVGLQQLTALTKLDMLIVAECPRLSRLAMVLDPKKLWEGAIELLTTPEVSRQFGSALCWLTMAASKCTHSAVAIH